MMALANLVTCMIDAGPAAPLIQAKEWRTFSFGSHGEWRSTWMPMSPCSNSIGRPSPHSSAKRRPGLSRYHPGVSVPVM